MKVNRKFIAEKAGVSTTTVSYVINNTPSTRISEAVKKRVLQIAQKYNYIPDASAKALVTGKTNNLGFIYKSSISDFFADPFTREVFTGLEREIEVNDYSLMFALLEKHKGEGLSTSARKMLSGRFVDGVILYGDTGIDVVKNLKANGTPFVLVDYLFDEIACNSILPDNRRGAKQAVQYLLSEGCRNICCLNGDLEEFYHPAYDERPSGYRDVMSDANLPVNIISTKPDIDSSYLTTMNILSEGECPDAFFATGDHMAIGCVRAIIDYNPSLIGQVRVIGFDDISWDEMEKPALSSIRVPKLEMGAEAVKILLNEVNSGNDSTKTLRLDTQLVVRDT